MKLTINVPDPLIGEVYAGMVRASPGSPPAATTEQKIEAIQSRLASILREAAADAIVARESDRAGREARERAKKDLDEIK